MPPGGLSNGGNFRVKGDRKAIEKMSDRLSNLNYEGVDRDTQKPLPRCPRRRCQGIKLLCLAI